MLYCNTDWLRSFLTLMALLTSLSPTARTHTDNLCWAFDETRRSIVGSLKTACRSDNFVPDEQTDSNYLSNVALFVLVITRICTVLPLPAFTFKENFSFKLSEWIRSQAGPNQKQVVMDIVLTSSPRARHRTLTGLVSASSPLPGPHSSHRLNFHSRIESRAPGSPRQPGETTETGECCVILWQLTWCFPLLFKATAKISLDQSIDRKDKQ